jgi:hypothetical protein
MSIVPQCCTFQHARKYRKRKLSFQTLLFQAAKRVLTVWRPDKTITNRIGNMVPFKFDVFTNGWLGVQARVETCSLFRDIQIFQVLEKSVFKENETYPTKLTLFVSLGIQSFGS